MLTLNAPAKINLTLEVLGKRPDGYHNIRSIVQTVGLCDVLTFASDRWLIIESDSPDWSAEKSLIPQAVKLVCKECRVNPEITIRVEKRIPLVSGLGGDSSDAAVTLKGLNEVWQLNLSQEKMLELAAKLGSDVPFFLSGGTALMEGRGEVITPLSPLPETWLVLMIPEVARPAGKTAQLYAGLQANHFTDGRITGRLLQAIGESRNIPPELLFNTFENVAFEQYVGLKTYREHILKTGATDIHLAGSGPALFSLVKNKADGEELIERLRGQGMSLFLTSTLKC